MHSDSKLMPVLLEIDSGGANILKSNRKKFSIGLGYRDTDKNLNNNH